LLDGRDVAQARPAALRRGIGYVIQQAGLFPHRTIEDNIATVPLLNGWRRAKARSRARELMDLVGLDLALARRYPQQLSGGQALRQDTARRLRRRSVRGLEIPHPARQLVLYHAVIDRGDRPAAGRSSGLQQDGLGVVDPVAPAQPFGVVLEAKLGPLEGPLPAPG
jgi:hypothetical protein